MQFVTLEHNDTHWPTGGKCAYFTKILICWEKVGISSPETGLPRMLL